MNLWSRILLFLRLKADASLDRAEDPLQVMDYAYGQHQELLRKVKQGLLEVVISKRRLEQQAERLHARVPEMEDQARRALSARREDLARIALERKRTALMEIGQLERHVSEVADQERQLTTAERQLSARIEELHIRRNALSARYTAAEAQVRVNESLSGLTGEFAALGMALGRAEEKIERMQAHAYAIDALIDAGTLALPSGTTDLVERELNELANRDAIEDELAALQAQLSSY